MHSINIFSSFYFTALAEILTMVGFCVFACLTIVIVSQLHVEADIVWQRTQILHQSVELPHQQDAGLPSVAARH